MSEKIDNRKVIVHKKTAKLAILFDRTWIGSIIQYDDWPDDKTISMESPFIFSDDRKFKLDEYEVIGKL